MTAADFPDPPIYQELRAGHVPASDEEAGTEAEAGAAGERVLADALAETGYVYTDPTTDQRWPRITDPDPADPPDPFPSGWGAEPTERDQAARDAGNA